MKKEVRIEDRRNADRIVMYQKRVVEAVKMQVEMLTRINKMLFKAAEK